MADLKNISDEKLNNLIRKGNALAFQELYNRYWKMLFLRAYKILGDEEAAADIIQDIFLDFWERASRIKILNVKAFLYKAVRFQVAKNIQRAKFTEEKIQIIGKYHTPKSVELYFSAEELKDEIDKSISSLPNRCREIFILSRMENLSNKEIAKKLNLSEYTVETQIKRALKKLKALLKVA
jgi:RNA polymerase sigma-70 factor (family 1)